MSDGARVARRAVAEPQTAAVRRPAVRSAPRLQRATLRLSQAHDPGEREAEQIARQVVTMPLPVLSPRERVGVLAARATAATPPPPLRAVPQDEVSPELTAEIKAELGAGQPLSADTRGFLEPRFKSSFAGVRIHTDGKAGSIAARLGASAFTFGRDVFFANGNYNPDSAAGMELLAHELTHTIQQREVVQRQLAPAAAAAGVLVTQRTAPKVQRSIVSRALDWIADKANNIPGYRMLTIVIGRNPINMAKVDRSGENILRALIEFIPGGHLIVEALENHGVMQKGGKFIEDQFAALGDLGGAIRDALMQFIDSLGWSDVFHLGDLWDRAKRIFTAPLEKAIDFGKNLVGGIASLVKEAIIKPLGRWAANNIPKWNLLVGVFGKNPISDEQESPAYALIGAFMELIGQQEIWENIKKGNAIGRAWDWFQRAMKGALSLVTSIPGRVMSTLRTLTIFDIVTLVGAFRKVVGTFASFVGDFIRWAGSTVLNLLEIIFSVVAPSVVPYLKKAGAAFSTIIKAPGRFISTLVAAGKQGFNQFKNKIVTYLRDALFKWLLGSADGAGIYFPKSFAPLELLKLGLSVLGLTWANIRTKLVAATNETTVKALETGFELVKTLVTQGPAAAWQQLLETLSNLKSMVVDAAIDFVKGEVVRIAIEKLVSFLTPAGAFIQAVIAIYRTITFIVNKLAEIGRLVAAFIDGIAALANGVIGAAADKVESVLATGLSLAISFLANFAGLGNVPKKVMDIIKKIRAPVDKALDTVIGWIIAQAKKLGNMILQAGAPSDPTQRVNLAIRDATVIAKGLTGKVSKPVLETAFAVVKTRYSLNAVEVFQRDGAWWARAVINPKTEGPVIKPTELGKIIEPVLVTVEKLWFAELDDDMDDKEAMQIAKGRADIAKGGSRGKVVLGAQVSPEAEIQMYRDIASGDIAINESKRKTMLAAVQIKGGGHETGGTYINDPGNQGRNFVTGARRYDEGIPEHVERVEDDVRRRRAAAITTEVAADPTVALKDRRRATEAQIQAETLENLSGGHRRLTERVEPARAEGMLTARKLAVGLVSSGQATAAEITHGDLNPMAFVGASGRDMNEPEKKAERHRRVGELIQRLRGAAAKLNLPGPVGPEIQQLAAAVNAWLIARGKSLKAGGTDRRAKLNAFKKAADALVEAFMALLRQQRR